MIIMSIGVDLAKNVFDVHGVDEHKKQHFESRLNVPTFYRFLFIYHLVLSQWKVAAVLITGPEN